MIMRKKELEKLVKTIEKLECQLEIERSTLKTKESEIKHLTRENKSISEKLERSRNKNVSLRKELKKN